MSDRQKLHRGILFDFGRGYDIKVKDIVDSPLLRPDDTIREIFSKMTLEESFKSNSEGEEHQHVFLKVWRWEEETDQEYGDRIKREEQQKLDKEKKDRDEWVRLKAKFGT